MILLRLISWPYARKHVLRTILSTLGIALGVSVFVGMNVANESVLAAFSTTVDRIAGKTELQITAGEAGFPEDVLERVQSAPGVRVAVPVIEAVVGTNIKGEGDLLVVGVDFTGDRSLRDYDFESADEAVVDDPLVFLAQPDSIILSSDFARNNGLRVGDRIPLGTGGGDRRFTIRGVMQPSGLASAFGGNLAVMDIYAAQKMLGRGRTFDRIDLALTPGRSIDEGIAQLESLLGPGFQVGRPSGRGQQFEAMIASYRMMMGASSLFALFIGMFIIHNSFAIAVTERRSEIGILRALGATQGQIRRVFLGESALMGVVGSTIGVLAGIGLARAISVSSAALLSDLYGIAREPGEVTVSPGVLALAMGIGIATSIVAALVPSHTAARVEPLQALRKGRHQLLSPGEHRARVAFAVVFAVLSLLSLTLGGTRAFFYASYLLAMIAVLLLAPLLSLGLARLIRPLLGRLRPVEGALAADSMIHAPRRTSSTVAALMLSVGLVVAFAGMALASYSSIAQWVNTAINPDLFVLPSPSIVKRTIRFPGSMASELERVPGVRRVQPVRQARILFRQLPITLVAVDFKSIRETTSVPAVAGDPDGMFTDAASGRGLLVSENLAGLQRLRLGDTFELPTPHDVVRLPIVGIVVDYTDQQGTVLIDRALFQQYWQDDTANFFRVYLASGADWADVKRGILERYAGVRQVFILNNDELRTYILGLTDQWFGLTYVQVGVAVLVAILGIVNTLTVSITDRRRELGVLRAVGGFTRQIRHTIWIEAVSTGLIGVLLGGALGAINLFYLLEIVREDLAGFHLDYVFPTTLTVVVMLVILCAAFLASLWPASAAVRGSLVEALEYE
jgi:putative ABC transport system permease protein